MSDKSLSLFPVKLKVVLVMLLLALIGLFSFSFTTSRRMADEIWKQLGMTSQQGTDGIRQSFLNGYLYYYGAKNARNIALNDRAAVAKNLLVYAKQYINSDVFRKEYELVRKNARPVEYTYPVKTKEEIRKQRVAEAEKSIRDMEESGKKNPDMAKIFAPSIEMLKKDLADYKNPDSKIIEQYYQGELANQEQRKKSFQESMLRWEKEYPADVKQKVKERLQQYLSLAATVNFDAELKQAGTKKKFVKPEYEGKPSNWKQVFRAGKDVYDVTKSFAENWVKEL